MKVHPSSEKLAAYAARKLPGDEMTHVLLHLDGCELCRASLDVAPFGGLAEDHDEPFFHLDFDEHLKPFVDGVADETTREIVLSHAELCDHCALSIDELRATAAELSAPTVIAKPVGASFWTAFRLALAFGAVAIIVGGIAFAVLREGRISEPVALTSPTPVSSVSPVVSPSTAPTVSPTITPSISPTPVMDDLAKYESELASVSPAMRRTLEEALRTGRPPQSRVNELLGAEPKLRGENEPQGAVSPNREAVIETNPVLRWPSAAAARWKVEIFDASGNIVASAETTNGSLRTPKPLRRAQLYRWQATPIDTEDPSTQTATTKPVAGSFYILDTQTTTDLQNLKSPNLRRLARLASGLKP